MVTEHSTPASKAELLERTHSAHAELEAALVGLSDEQIDRKDRDGGWSIKDHVGHIIGWRNHALAALQGQMAHEGMRVEREQFTSLHIDDLNEILYEQHQDRPPSDVLAELREQHRQIVKAIEDLSDDDLQRPYQSERATSPRPLIDQVAGITARHTRAHLPDIERLAGASG